MLSALAPSLKAASVNRFGAFFRTCFVCVFANTYAGALPLPPLVAPSVPSSSAQLPGPSAHVWGVRFNKSFCASLYGCCRVRGRCRSLPSLLCLWVPKTTLRFRDHCEGAQGSREAFHSQLWFITGEEITVLNCDRASSGGVIPHP